MTIKWVKGMISNYIVLNLNVKTPRTNVFTIYTEYIPCISQQGQKFRLRMTCT